MKPLSLLITIFIMLVILAQLGWGHPLDESFNKATALYKDNDLAGAAVEFQKVVEILKKEKKPADAQKIQMNVGVIFFQLNKFSEAITAYEAALALYPKPDAGFKVKLLRNLSIAHYKAGNYALRAEILEELLTDVAQLDPLTKAELMADLGDSYRRNEIYTKAVDSYQQAFKLFQSLKNQDKELLVLTALGLCQAKLGRYDEASGSLKNALELSNKTNNPQNLAEINSNLGIIHWDQGDYTSALNSVQVAQKIEEENNLKQNLSADRNNEGLIYKSVGNYPNALESFEKSISLAREIKDGRSEAIALGNRALVNRILGKNKAAKEDYTQALALYERVKFQEGMASCFLGLGKIYEIEENDYRKAYDNYQKALNIYTKLGNPGYQAEALNQIGGVLRKSIQPQRITRDLVFPDREPTFINVKPEDAAAKSMEAYQKALALGKSTGRKEVTWSSLQGIGFIQYTQGKLPESLENYKAAIGLVTSMYGSKSEKDLTGDYLKDKADLFTEAIEVLSSLFKKNKNLKYLKFQMQYQEMLDKEVQKSAMYAANLNFVSPDKNNLFKSINECYAKKYALENIMADRKSRFDQLKSMIKLGNKEEEAQSKALEKELGTVSFELSTAEATLKNYLKKWHDQYPEDADLFNATAQVNIDEICKLLDPDQAILIYFSLSDMLNILCVTSEKIEYTSYNIGSNELTSLIRDDLMYRNIQKFSENDDKSKSLTYYNDCNNVLSKLYDILIKPVEHMVNNKKRLTVVPSKYIGYVPFCALVSSRNAQGEPRFLVFDKTVNYIRLNYITSLLALKSNPVSNASTFIGIGNPKNSVLVMSALDAAESEVKSAGQVVKNNGFRDIDLLIGSEATESAFKTKIGVKNYNMFYFATHAVPFAEVYYIYSLCRAKPSAKAGEMKCADYINFYEKNFLSKSPLNGFIYMANNDIEREREDGTLRIKEIIEFPPSFFKFAQIAILSACNTAVTYAPKVRVKVREELEGEESARELAKQGWLPGIDQVSLVDAFMRRGFRSVIGTQWQADDLSTGYIMRYMFSRLNTMSPANSLREAQLKYLANPSDAFAEDKDHTIVPLHPFYWAILGDYGN